MTEQELRAYIEAIRPADETAMDAARRRQAKLAKPPGSLGQLEDAITKIAALTRDPDVRLDKRMLFVACADNGVVCQGVSQSDESVTRAVTRALGQGTSTVNYLAAQANCTVIPVDIGVKDFDFTDGVLPRKCKNGTDDCSVGPAMTRAECTQAIETGIALALDAKAQGADILLTGEMGIGNTTTSSAVLAALTGADVEAVTGRGGGLTDEGFLRKKEVLRQSLALHRPDKNDVIGVLAGVGGLDLAAMTGAFLGCAHERVPAAVDGFISIAAALCAVRLCPAVRDYLFLSHDSYEVGYRIAAEELGLTPCLHLGMRLGEGSGCPLLFRILQGACAVLDGMATFPEAAIEDEYLTPIRQGDAFTVDKS